MYHQADDIPIRRMSTRSPARSSDSWPTVVFGSRDPEQLDVWPAVRQGVLEFLHSGRIPGQGKETQNRPLPAPEAHTTEPPRSKM